MISFLIYQMQFRFVLHCPVLIVDNILSEEIDGEIHRPLDTFGHRRVFKVASVEEAVVAWRLKFFKKCLPMEKNVALWWDFVYEWCIIESLMIMQYWIIMMLMMKLMLTVSIIMLASPPGRTLTDESGVSPNAWTLYQIWQQDTDDGVTKDETGEQACLWAWDLHVGLSLILWE